MFGLELIDILVVVAYLVGITAVGYFSKSAIHNREDFLLAGRKNSIPLMVMHSFGTGTHTDQAAGVVAESYKTGMAGIWAQWNWMLCTPFYWVLAPLLRRTRCLTIADVYEEMFGKSVSILTVIVSSFGTALAMGVMLKGTSVTVQAMLNIPPEQDPIIFADHSISFYVSLIVMTALFLLYGAAGGLVGAVRTDFIQGICIIILSAIALPYAFHGIGGMAGLAQGVKDQATAQALAGMPEPHPSMSLIGGSFSLLMILALLFTALFSIVSQSHIMSVTSSCKTEWEGRVGMTYGNFLKRFCTLGWCLLGVAWLVRNPGIAPDDLQHADKVFGYAVGDLLPVGLRGLMLASIMAAAMSTCDSMMIAVAGLFTDNVYRRHWKPDKSESHYVNVSRVVGVLIVLVSIGFAIVTPSIFSGLKTFWQVTASIGIAWFLGMFWRRANAAGAWASFLVAGAVMAYMNYVTKLSTTFSFLPLADWEQNLDKPEIAAIKLGIFLPAGLIAGIVVSLITKPPDKKLKDRFFIKLHTHIADDDLLPQRLGDEEPAEQPDEPDTEDAAERPEPGTLEAAFPPEKWLINRWGLLLPVPSKQTWGGFLIACGVMVAIMLGTWLLVSV